MASKVALLCAILRDSFVKARTRRHGKALESIIATREAGENAIESRSDRPSLGTGSKDRSKGRPLLQTMWGSELGILIVRPVQGTAIAYWFALLLVSVWPKQQ